MKMALVGFGGMLAGLGAAGALAIAQTPTRAPTGQRAPTTTAASVEVEDARRAAATRLLAVSRFRERQDLQVDDGIRAARADLTEECLDRAAANRDLSDCRATARPDARMTARLAATRQAMLDEIMVASQTVYASRFNTQEMEAVTRFFQTPAGRKYAVEYSRLLDEVVARRRAIARRYLVQAARR